MKIPLPPFDSREKSLVYALMMGGDCVGYEKITVSSTTLLVRLTVPASARYAQVLMEADRSATSPDKACRFLECPVPFLSGNYTDNLSPSSGMILGDLGVYEVRDTENMKNFRMLSTQDGVNHILHVQYFS